MSAIDRYLCLASVLLAMIFAPEAAVAGSDEIGPSLTPRGVEPSEPSVVVVKFRDDAAVRLRGGALVSLTGVDLSQVADALVAFGRPTPTRLFTRAERDLDEERRHGMHRSGRSLADLNGYYELAIAPAEIGRFVEALSALDTVQLAYPAPRPAPPPGDIPPTTPDFESNQGYLEPAPGGIDARHAWSHAGGRGEGIYVVDIEYDWNDNHEDLNRALGGKQCYTPNGNYIDHGTAVLGELGGGQNAYGITGIVPLADFGMVTQDPVGMSNSVARAVNCAVSIMGPGDVMLLETQAYGPGGNYVPSEWNQAEFDAISTATALGITVVEAAGNGNQDLDDPVFLGRFDRAVRDSGAIIVGAGASPGGSQPDRSKLSFSTYGSRVDAQGWGQNVATTGYGSLFTGGGDPNQYYTATFNGTSSASPIVAGAAAAIQGIRKARGGLPLDPLEVRRILTETGSPQQNGPFAGQIGPRPDLARAIAELGVFVLSAVSIEDFAPLGNANGVLEPGETATIRLSVTNAGTQTSTGTRGVISTGELNARITTETADWPDLPSATTFESLSPHHQVTIQPSALCGDTIPFALAMSSDQLDEQSQFKLPLGRDSGSYASTDVPLSIPKTSGTGVTSTAAVADDFLIADAHVTLGITHENIGQLRIELRSPSGTTVVLHDHGNAGASNLSTTYDRLTSPDGPGVMDDFDGESAQGTWSLMVVDDQGGPEPAGTINSWSVELLATAAFDCSPFPCGEPIPSELGAGLEVGSSGTSDLLLQWSAEAGATTYRVWRSAQPDMNGATLVGQTAATSLVEAGGLLDPSPIVHYLVRAVNGCEWEGP